MHRRSYPNGRLPETVVEAVSPEAFPPHLSRMGERKLKFLIRGVAQTKRGQKVLELFSGTCLSTVLLAQSVGPRHVVSVDLHFAIGAAGWRYVAEENYRLLAEHYRLHRTEIPRFVCSDAATLPFPDETFDRVLAPDSPRTAANRFEDSAKDAGKETVLTPEEQRELFHAAAREAHRVLVPGGVFAATAPQAWIEGLPFARVDVQPGPSEALRFAHCKDPVVYLSAKK